MTDVVWILECPVHGIYERDVKKTRLKNLHDQHIKRTHCMEVKELYAIQLDQRFTF